MPDKNVIVFPTDFSEVSMAALPWVKRMAAVTGGTIHCLYVVEEPHIYATLDMGPVPIPSADELAASARTRLEKFVADNLKGLDTRPVSKVLVGRPADETSFTRVWRWQEGASQPLMLPIRPIFEKLSLLCRDPKKGSAEPPEILEPDGAPRGGPPHADRAV